MIKVLSVICMLFLFVSIGAAQLPQMFASSGNIPNKFSDSVVSMAAGKQFAAGRSKKLFWGKHYRREWTTVVSFPVLKMDTLGGLTPLKLGGGHQSKTLRVLSGDGKEYVLRTIDKDLDVLIPGELKGTFINDLVNDQISTAHPYGPLAIAQLADYLSIMHTHPKIYYVPDGPQLGEFHEEIGNKLCLFEERPNGDGWAHTDLTHNADDIINTEKLEEKVTGNTKNRVDQPELLKIRLFDMIINDWDRHEDQWVWAEHKKDNVTIYEPFARDRDQAFSKTDGIAMYFLAMPWALRPLENMDKKVKDVLGANFSARNLDHEFLNELNKEDWERNIANVQSLLTDDAIKNSVNVMPPAVNKISGDFLIKRLIVRRDNLSGYGMRYYNKMNKYVTIAGSEKKEHFLVNSIGDGQISVTGLRENEDTFYHRVFDHDVTKEINIYGLQGADEFTFSGNGNNRFIVRTIGGEGDNTYKSDLTGGGKKIRVYDTQQGDIMQGKMMRINRKDDTLFRYKRLSTKYDWYIPLIVPGYNPDDGFSLGLGFLYKKQKWGKTPFGWQQAFTIDYAFGTSAIGFGYKGLFKQTFGKWDFDFAASYKGPKFILNYYGTGNNTTLPVDDKKFYRTGAKELFISPGVSRSSKHATFRVGLNFEQVRILETNDKFITSVYSDVDPSVFERKNYGGLSAEWEYSLVNSERNPQKGIKFNIGSSFRNDLEETSKSMVNLHSSLAFYFTLLKTFTIAHRTGFATNFGDYEFYYANTLGRSENLRGYWRSRFSGRTSFYQNTELRCKIADLRGYVLRGQLGILGFIDDGRVWIKNEVSSTFHTGYGGGFYFVPFNALALNFTYATSTEKSMFTFKAGFFF